MPHRLDKIISPSRPHPLALELCQRANIFWFTKSSSVKLSRAESDESGSNVKEVFRDCSCGVDVSGSGLDTATKCQQEALTNNETTLDVPADCSRSMTTIVVSFPFSALSWLGLLTIFSA